MEEKILMHKDIEVAKLKYLNNQLIDINILNYNHMPIGSYNDAYPQLKNAYFSMWETDRCIPTQRQNIDGLLRIFGLKKAKELIKYGFGCSLTDCYWYKPIDCKEIKWDMVNYFKNGFDETFGDILINNNLSELLIDNISLNSPDMTTNGYLPKKWIMDNKGDFFLYKKGNNSFTNINEIASSIIANELGLKTVKYKLYRKDNKEYTVCKNFIENDNYEYVSLGSVNRLYKNDRNKVIKFLKDNNLWDYTKNILLIDFFIGNDDRHINNLGFIRNPDNLSIYNMAPGFDFGGSIIIEDGKIKENSECKFLLKSRKEILKKINYSNFTKIDKEKINKKINNVLDIYTNITQRDKQLYTQYIINNINIFNKSLEKYKEKEEITL